MADRMKSGRMKAEGKRQKEKARSAGSSFILHPSSFALCIALNGAMGSGAAWCQVMNDPTRPPVGFAQGDPEAPAVGSGLVLQSVLISSSGRAAIINGQMVKLGQKYGDAVLIRVAESEVVLKSADVTQVLKMYPGVEKRESAPPGAKTVPRRTQGRRSADPASAGAAPDKERK
jgi:MSHA biogenesis protein MshK